MSVNPGYPNASFGYNPYGAVGGALSGSGFAGAPALSGVGYGAAAPASGLGYYGGYSNAGYGAGLGGYGAGYGAGYGYAPAAAPVAAAAPAVGAFQLDEQTVAEIDSRIQYLVRRRQPVLRRQIIKVPGPAGRVQQVVRRLPTPPPDLIERVYVVKPQRDVVNLLIERPGTPPPQVQERRVVGRPHRPVINQQVVRVAPRTQLNQAAPNLASYGYASQPAYINYGGYQPVAQPVAQPYSVSYSASYDNLGGYGGYQPAAYAGYQPAAYAYQPAAYAAQPAYAAYQPYGYDQGYAAYSQPSVVGYAAQPSYGIQPSTSGLYAGGYPAGYGAVQPVGYPAYY